ncbi:methyl-accepting chemotaxis protein [Pelomonas sp. BJYL3]|uniref:methyl-accepting chemotaxis protein n=1 Tax=Pelomonas sp. BJYL3 TaxID=2976697 RepID=UPI0022B39CAC|nr:methyl-accepting chemotaxis protein [Pelomonas sp. BJYL3]
MLRQLSIKARLGLAFSLMVLLMLVLGGGGWLATRAMFGAFETFNTSVVASLRSVDDLRSGMLTARRYEKDMIFAAIGVADFKRAQERWEEAMKSADKGLKDLELRVKDPKVREGLTLIRNNFDAYRSGMQSVMAQLAKGGMEGDLKAAWDAPREAKKSIDLAEQGLEQALTTVDRFVEMAHDKIAGVYATITTVIVVALLAGMGLAAFIGWRIAHSLLLPIQQGMAFASAVENGNLDEHLHIEGKDELTALSTSLVHMQEGLRGIVLKVREGSESIQVAASEVATGNQDLSARTEQAAASLEETASSMEQLTETVRHNADSARQANQLASSASSVAQRGGDVVQQVVHTMGEISTSSRKIGDIIGVIDGIAFQTNILALNAAVEAARAGEQGRGFAVVAGEVRSLAQRSAEAAKEIKSLITGSMDRIEAGASLVQEAGSTMQEIVSSVQRVTDIMGEISASTLEQSTSIGEVGQAITNLDQMTQQNAALVEQGAAAASSLRDQAVGLTAAISSFRVSPRRA